MTETEDEILDELYFVTSFPELVKQLSMPEKLVAETLEDLVIQGYVKCFFPDPDSEIAFDKDTFPAHCREYFFLATKAGLLAHNSR